MKNVFRGSWVLVSILILALAGCAGAGEKTGTYVDDSTITTKVKSDLLAAKDISSTHISVATTNGVVTLTGTAATTQESNKAAEIARGVAGVKDVKNDIHIQ
jgi:hyperosmotically inducible periplasmic protein